MRRRRRIMSRRRRRKIRSAFRRLTPTANSNR